MRLPAQSFAASLILAVFFTAPCYSAEPTYDGKTLGEWLDAYSIARIQSNGVEQAKSALLSIGTNAIPCLLDWGESDDSKLQYRSSTGFRVLGPTAATAIPVLAKRLAGTNEDLAATAARSLNWIGGPAFPVLLNAITNRHYAIRSWAIQNIDLSPQLRYIIPLLLHDLDDSNPYIRWRAAQALGSLHLEAYRVVPRLSKLLLEDADSTVLIAALVALQRFGAFAGPAIPAVTKLLINEDQLIRTYATNTIWWYTNAIAYVRSQAHQ